MSQDLSFLGEGPFIFVVIGDQSRYSLISHKFWPTAAGDEDRFVYQFRDPKSAERFMNAIAESEIYAVTVPKMEI